MRKRGSLGIDIGGTKMLFALFDDRFGLLDEVKVKTRADKDEAHFSETFVGAAQALVEKAEKREVTVLSIGIGCAGSVDDARQTLTDSPNIPFLKGYQFAARLRKVTDASVMLVNDVQAGLYGEQQLGVAVGLRHVVGVFLGTGVGGALILDGRPYLGAWGHAGNIGHYLLEPLGPLAGSDRHGVLDDMVGRTAIAGAAASLAAKQNAPNLLRTAGTDVSKIRSGDLAAAIAQGDKSVEDLMRSRARIVGIALSNIVDFLNPEMIVLGGGLTDAMPDLIRDEVRAGISGHATPAASDGLQVVVAKLRDHAVTTGAAKLASDRFLSGEPAVEVATAKT